MTLTIISTSRATHAFPNTVLPPLVKNKLIEIFAKIPFASINSNVAEERRRGNAAAALAIVAAIYTIEYAKQMAPHVRKRNIIVQLYCGLTINIGILLSANRHSLLPEEQRAVGIALAALSIARLLLKKDLNVTLIKEIRAQAQFLVHLECMNIFQTLITLPLTI